MSRISSAKSYGNPWPVIFCESVRLIPREIVSPVAWGVGWKFDQSFSTKFVHIFLSYINNHKMHVEHVREPFYSQNQQVNAKGRLGG